LQRLLALASVAQYSQVARFIEILHLEEPEQIGDQFFWRFCLELLTRVSLLYSHCGEDMGGFESAQRGHKEIAVPDSGHFVEGAHIQNSFEGTIRWGGYAKLERLADSSDCNGHGTEVAPVSFIGSHYFW
jgi:hypothetical protein